MSANNEKQRALEMALAEIEKQFGKGSIMKLSDAPAIDIEAIPTGALNLDIALGVGGMPRGRIIEIFGPESSGKTTLTLSIVAQAQKLGGIAAFVDAEHAMDPDYAKRLGVNIDELLVSQPESGEQALQIVETLVRSSAIDIIVVDSVAALVPKAEIDGEMGDSLPGLQARLMSQALRKLTAIVAKSKTCVIFINQLREKIGVMFGSPETTPGGKALKFYSSVRLDIRRIETIKNGQDAVGNRVRVKTVKNKCAPPFREAIFDIIFGEGISREGTVLDMAVDLNIVEKAGSWFAYEGNRVGQGRDAVRAFLRDNQSLCDAIEKKVREEIIRLNKIKLDEAVVKSQANASRYSEFPTPSQLAGGKVQVGEGGAAVKAEASKAAAAAPVAAKPATPAPASKPEFKPAAGTDKK
ncbi:MAG TPA: recombinase RecA [bacterium]|jgi:recombination protein RecA|nr:recombinase RecA [bacterium]